MIDNSMTLALAKLGFGVRDMAIPSPMPGCVIKKGVNTVAVPTITAGPMIGLCIHGFR